MLDQMLRWLTAERRPAALYLLAGGLGFGLAWYLLGWEGIHGTSVYWDTTRNDTLQGIAALRYYLAEPWSWQIFDVGSYGVPEGTNLILTDSIPILAVPAKLLSGLLPAGFHYFGYWMAFCLIAQGIAMTALLVMLGQRTLLATAGGTVLVLLQTVLLTRFFHVALMAQFVILLVIILGVLLMRDGDPGRSLALLAVLVGASFFIHLYLFAMVVTLSGAFVAQAVIARRIPWQKAVLWLGVVGVGTVAMLALTGLWSSARTGVGGLGYYSLNPLSPLVGNVDATGGQYEGYSYVGVGVLVLLVAALVLARQEIIGLAKRFWVPLLAAVLMSVFALSPEVWLGEAARIELPWFGLEWLGERFRSTGRFVWPLIYVTIAAVLVLMLRRAPNRTAVLLLLGAILVQVVDMAPLVADVREILDSGEEVLLPADEWSELIAAQELVRIAPQHCIVQLGDTSLANREIQRMTARFGVPVTEASLPRQIGDCEDPVLSQPVAPGELRVVWSALIPGYGQPGAFCVEFDLGTACIAGDTAPGAAALSQLPNTNQLQSRDQ